MPQEFLYGVRTRRVASAGLDGLTPILLIAFVLGMVGLGVYGQSQIPKLIEAGKKVPSAGVLWTTIVVYIVMFFAITGPMVLLGVFAASKIMRFPLSGAAYLKACGAATVPMLVVMSLFVLPANRVLLLLMVVAIIPAVFFVLKTAFELSLAEGGVTFVISAITGVIGLGIASGIAKAVMQSGAESEQVASGGNSVIDKADSVVQSLPVVPGPKVKSGGTNTGPTRSAADAFRDTLAARVGQKVETSREAQEQELATLKAQAEQNGSATRADVADLLKQLEARAAAAPSEKPDPAIFQEPVATTAWKPADVQLASIGADEVSFNTFNFRPPKDYRPDLGSSESDEKGLVFSTGKIESGKLTFRALPGSNAKQRRPWVTRERFQTSAAEAEKLFTIDGAGATTVEEGSINGIPFTRVAYDALKRPGTLGKSVQYVTRTNDGWVVIDAVAPSNSPASLDLLEASIRTIRPRPAGDPKIDPFGVDALVARFAEDPEHIGAMLRQKGKGAEDAVLPLLKSDDPRSARAAAAVLGDIGTAKSVPALQEAARASDAQLAGAARESIKRLQPNAMDEVTEALIDLESTDHFKQKAALTKLAKVTPDEARREKVATAIESEILGKDLFFIADEAAPAMANWAGKNTVTRLLPLLEQNASIHQRHVAMEVFGKLKDKRTVFPVVRWVLLDTDNASKCLIEMGPVAEDEIIKLTKAPEANGRTAAARILQEIGTAKSLAPLKRASQDPRDPGAAAAARVAYDMVNERVKAAKSTTAPAQ